MTALVTLSIDCYIYLKFEIIGFEDKVLCLLGFSFIILYFVGSLTLYHIWLVFSGLTTNEDLRAKYKINPFNNGIR